jgi:glutamyl-tRNA reductase
VVNIVKKTPKMKKNSMNLKVVGISHRTAPIDVRENLTFTEDSLKGSLRWLTSTDQGGFSEGIILSTCNRTEFYLVDSGNEGVKKRKSKAFELPVLKSSSHLQKYFYHIEEEKAVRHLFSVASGLDSQVIGEGQVLGQVREGFEFAQGVHATGPLLSELFQHASRVGKRSRSETSIARNPASIPSVAFQQVKKSIGDLRDKMILIIGTGKVNEITMKILAKEGCRNIVLASRTFDRAKNFARKIGGTALPIAELVHAFESVDVVITSTTAPHLIIEASTLKKVMDKRMNKTLLLMDLALPRDIDPEVRDIDNVTLFNIDDLKSFVDSGFKERKKESKKVKAIVDEEVKKFGAWYQTREVIPTLVALRERFERYRQYELEKALTGISEKDTQVSNVLESFSTRLLNKILHEPSTQLKSIVDDPEATEYIKAIEKIFKLNREDGDRE